MGIAIIRTILIVMVMIPVYPALCQTMATAQEPKVNASPVLKRFSVYADGLIGPIYSATINAEIRLGYGKSGVRTYYLRVGAGSDNTLITDGGPGYLGALTMLKRTRNDKLFEISAGWFSGKSSVYDTSINYPILDIGRRIYYPSGFMLRYHAGILGVGGSVGFAF
jgi:hypothetical protein